MFFEEWPTNMTSLHKFTTFSYVSVCPTVSACFGLMSLVADSLIWVAGSLIPTLAESGSWLLQKTLADPWSLIQMTDATYLLLTFAYIFSARPQLGC